jgi:hypothetical protein
MPKRRKLWVKLPVGDLSIPAEAFHFADIQPGDVLDIRVTPKGADKRVAQRLEESEADYGTHTLMAVPCYEEGFWKASILDARSGGVLGEIAEQVENEWQTWSGQPPDNERRAPEGPLLQWLQQGKDPVRRPILEARDDGIHVDAASLQSFGVTSGQRFEIVPLPDSTRITYFALKFVARKLGDAIGVEQPVWNGSEWKVRLIAPDEETDLGQLVLNAQGQVIEELSATYESVRATFNVASTPHKAAA